MHVGKKTWFAANHHTKHGVAFANSVMHGSSASLGLGAAGNRGHEPDMSHNTRSGKDLKRKRGRMRL